MVFSAKKEELEQAFKNDEPEPEQPKSAPESEQKLAEDKAAGCYENRRALKACGTQCFSAAKSWTVRKTLPARHLGNERQLCELLWRQG